MVSHDRGGYRVMGSAGVPVLKTAATPGSQKQRERDRLVVFKVVFVDPNDGPAALDDDPATMNNSGCRDSFEKDESCPVFECEAACPVGFLDEIVANCDRLLLEEKRTRSAFEQKLASVF